MCGIWYWFPESPQIPKSKDAQVPYIKNGKNSAFSCPSGSTDSQPQFENTLCNPLLVESMDAKPGDTEGQLCFYLNKSACKWTHEVQTHAVQGSTVFTHGTHIIPSVFECSKHTHIKVYFPRSYFEV